MFLAAIVVLMPYPRSRHHLRFEDFAQIHFGDSQMAVMVAFDVGQPFQILRGDAEHEPFREDRHAVAPPVAQALHDRTYERVDNGAEANRRRKLLRYQRERGTCRFANPERQMACLPPHGHDEVPARRCLRIDH